MKALFLTCALVGLTCLFAVGAGAQIYGGFANGPPAYGGGSRSAMTPDQITASMRAAGLEPLSRPILRGAVYHVRAVNRARAQMQVTVDARSGRVLSAARVTSEVHPPAAGEAGLALRHEPAGSPPADLPLEGRTLPAGRPPDPPAAKLAVSPGPEKPVMVPIAPLE